MCTPRTTESQRKETKKPSIKKKKSGTKELGLNGTNLLNSNPEGWKTVGHELKILRVQDFQPKVLCPNDQ